MWKGMKKAYGVCILHLQCNSYETENITMQVFDNQMLTNIREFQIITYLGHQLYTYLDVCYIEGEFVDIV